MAGESEAPSMEETSTGKTADEAGHDAAWAAIMGDGGGQEFAAGGAGEQKMTGGGGMDAGTAMKGVMFGLKMKGLSTLSILAMLPKIVAVLAEYGPQIMNAWAAIQEIIEQLTGPKGE